MEKTIKSRSEMNPEYMWDLSVVFKDDDAWYQTLEEVKEKIKEYEKYQDHFMESATSLYELFELDSDISRILERLYVYSNSKSDEDKSNNAYLKMSGELENAYTLATTSSAYIVPTLLKYQYTKIEEYMKEDERLKKFERELKNIFRYKPYVLEEKEEKLLS